LPTVQLDSIQGYYC